MQKAKELKHEKLNKDMAKKKAMGQYFTPEIVADFMANLITNKKNPSVFEPCAGQGIFLQSLKKKGLNKIKAYEIDNTLENKSDVNITYKNTLIKRPQEKFDVVIGNPPYVRWKNIDSKTQEILRADLYWKDRINGLNDLLYPFILLSVDLLKEGGELIFITPTFWTSTLHSKLVREKLLQQGEITHFINFEEMNVFNNVSSNILIFRFVKNKKGRKMKVVKITERGKISSNILKEINEILKDLEKKDFASFNGYEAYLHNQFKEEDSWNPLNKEVESLIEAIEKNSESRLGEMAEICNGMVSGLDQAFKVTDISNFNNEEKKKMINVAKAKNLNKYFLEGHHNYIFLNDSAITEKQLSNLPNIKSQLSNYKEDLEKRYSYQRNIPYWEWVFLRNKKHIEKSKSKIVVPCKERFDSKQFVRFALVKGDYYVTQDTTAIIKNQNVKEDVKYLLAVLNSDLIFNWLKNKGLRRGGVLEFSERPLSIIPIKRINWENKKEVEIYNSIINKADFILKNKDYTKTHSEINHLVNEIYGIS